MLAVLAALIPLRMEKGSILHKIGGRIYLWVAVIACLAGIFLAAVETRLLLFSFQCFLLYLLVAGWRALQPDDVNFIWLDLGLVAGLVALACLMFGVALVQPDPKQTFYLGFFALAAGMLAWQDLGRWHQQRAWQRVASFFGAVHRPMPPNVNWLGRHVSLITGSVIMNLSVVVLTLLPLSLHWIWPVLLMIAAILVAHRHESRRRQQLRDILRWQRH